MMAYSPINFRRLDWFAFTLARGSWRELGPDEMQAALTRRAWCGYLKGVA